MYNRGKIMAGILIFMVLMTFPFWYGKGRSVPPPEISLDTPEIHKLAIKKCIEPTPYMRASHMELVDSWRGAVVRDGNQVYVNHEGKKFSMSLSHTCLNCHANKEKFCDACHDYSGIQPACWSCHVVPKESRP